MDKVGKADGEKLLFIQIADSYKAVRQGSKAVSEAKEDMGNSEGDER